MTAGRRFRFSLPLLAALAFFPTSPAAAQGVEQPRVPLRTALRELNTLRAEYADAYNKKDASALTAMYLSDAVVIRGDGTTLLGMAAIGQALGKDAASWKRITLASDTTRVYGNTAWDVGTMTNGSEPGVSRYLAVLRRGVQEWKISSLAVVPMASAAASR